MKKVLSVFVVAFMLSTNVFAGPFDKFNSKLNTVGDRTAQRYLDNLASDMGSVMTGGNYGVSSSLGLANFNMDMKLSYVNVSNEIMAASDTSVLLMPIVRAELGLPYGIDVLGKYGYLYGSNMYGLGLRYLVYEGGALIVPSVTVQGMYAWMNTDEDNNKFDTDNIALGLILTFNIPFVTPYISVGWDQTTLTPKSSNKQHLKGDVSNMGYGAGVSVSLLMLHGSLGISYYNDDVSYTFGLSLGL